MKNGSKPILEEKGPYIFQEWHKKMDIVWNNNGTVTYKQIKNWIHVSGDLDENITTVNLPLATLVSKVWCNLQIFTFTIQPTYCF